MSLVFDSGSDIEDTHAQLRPDLFNAQPETDTVIKNTIDSRSDNKVRERERREREREREREVM